MKKHILFLLTALTLLAALFPAAVSAADNDAHAIHGVTVNGSSVEVTTTIESPCAVWVGLYDRNGKLTASQTRVVYRSDWDPELFMFDSEIGADLYAKAFLLDAETCAPLCEGRDSDTKPDVERFLDLMFIAANSVTKAGDHYACNAIVNNQFQSVKITMNAELTAFGVSYTPGQGHDDAGSCALLNTWNYNADDWLTAGRFVDYRGYVAGRAQGVKPVSADEIRLDTHGGSSYLKTLSYRPSVYFVHSGGVISKIALSDIAADADAYVYYAEVDGQITDLFVVESAASSAAHAIDYMSSLPDGYRVVSSQTTALPGETIAFQVLNADSALATSAEIRVMLRYVGSDGFGRTFGSSESDGVWSAVVPSDIADGSTISVIVESRAHEIDYTSGVPDGYRVVSSQTTALPGETIAFQVLNADSALATSAEIRVTLLYASYSGFSQMVPASYSNGVWSAVLPSDAAYGSTIRVIVEQW